jgi:hypothetical protein
MFNSSAIILRASLRSRIIISGALAIVPAFRKVEGRPHLNHKDDLHVLLYTVQTVQTHSYHLQLHHHRQFTAFHACLLEFYPLAPWL